MAGRWLLLGDSHLEAIGPKLRPLLAAKGITARIIPRRGQGVNSFVDDEAVFRAVQEFRPDVTVLFLGGNDGREDAASYRTKVQRLLGQVPNPVWVGPWFASDPEVQGRHLRAGADIRAVTSRMRVPFLDGQIHAPRAQLRDDGVHYTAAGYQRIVDRIYPLLTSAASSFPWLPLVAGLGIGAALTWWALQ